jgi:glucose-6-phosphate 1-dehydrogenase
MGDLAHKKIFPALYHMVQHGHLDVPVIGVARAGRTNEHLKARVRDSVQQQGDDIDQAALAKLLKLLRYVGGDYEDAATFEVLKKTLGSVKSAPTPSNIQILRKSENAYCRNGRKARHFRCALLDIPTGVSSSTFLSLLGLW